ncbi:hypothetical protein [Pectobacterium versatile]|uniref:hypothetical protein n=1 Tax=Pectobacterium versatile TaxID=2488639 RepID=UPI001F3F9E41|nr:hypothetical protein [Pectobacterium versatile]
MRTLTLLTLLTLPISCACIASEEMVIQRFGGEFIIVDNQTANMLFKANYGLIAIPAFSDKTIKPVYVKPYKAQKAHAPQKTIVTHDPKDSIFIRLERENAN